MTMDRETASTLSKAAEVYARLINGQFDVLPFEVLIVHPGSFSSADFCERRDRAEVALEEARKALFPNLIYPHQSYGVGHNRESDKAWNVHQVLRYTRAWHDHPEGGITVDFNKPMSFSDVPMPVCEVIE